MIGGVFPGGVDFDPATYNSVWLTIGSSALELPKFKFGDTKNIDFKPAEDFDLFFLPTTWPDHKQIHCEFGALHKFGVTIRDHHYQEFKRLMRSYPGWIAYLEFPNGTTFWGIISNAVYSEVDNCGITIAFDFDITFEWFPGRMVVA